MGEASLPSIPPAFKALLEITNPWLDEAQGRDMLSLLGKHQLDWAEVYAHARRHRVVPFLAHRLDLLGLLEGIHEETVATLRHEAQTATFHEMAMLGLVKSLKRNFGAEGVEFLVIKGLVLSSSCYGRLGLRVNHDVDILVAPEQLHPAHAILAQMGFTRVEPAGAPSPTELESWIRRHKDWIYVSSSSGAVVELHHRLFDNPALFDAETSKRKRVVKLFGQVEVLTLEREDEVAYLALHGALHAWSRLKWLIDLAFIFRELGPGELSDLFARRSSGPAGRALRQAANLCRELFGVEPLAEARSTLMDSLLASAARRAMMEGGVEELEASRFGTTLKNASHYLLWQKPSYLAAELAYDLTDTSRDNLHGNSDLPKWFARPVSWIARRWSRPSAS